MKGAVDTTRDGPIRVQYSQAPTGGTITLNLDGVAVEGSSTISGDALQFVPSQRLRWLSTYTVEAPGVTFSFTTADVATGTSQVVGVSSSILSIGVSKDGAFNAVLFPSTTLEWGQIGSSGFALGSALSGTAGADTGVITVLQSRAVHAAVAHGSSTLLVSPTQTTTVASASPVAVGSVVGQATYFYNKPSLYFRADGNEHVVNGDAAPGETRVIILQLQSSMLALFDNTNDQFLHSAHITRSIGTPTIARAQLSSGGILYAASTRGDLADVVYTTAGQLTYRHFDATWGAAEVLTGANGALSSSQYAMGSLPGGDAVFAWYEDGATTTTVSFMVRKAGTWGSVQTATLTGNGAAENGFKIATSPWGGAFLLFYTSTGLWRLNLIPFGAPVLVASDMQHMQQMSAGEDGRAYVGFNQAGQARVLVLD